MSKLRCSHTFERVPVLDNAYFAFAPGSRDPYAVNLDAMTCTCGAFKEHGYCKHEEWLIQQLAATPAALTPAPTVPTTRYEPRHGWADQWVHPADLIEALLL